MYGIEVREHGGVTLVELRGELDLFTLADLRSTLNDLLNLNGPTLMDLSGITFLDLISARELAVRSQTCANHLTLSNPSPQVIASVRAFDLGEWLTFHPAAEREAPPLVSEAPS